MSAVWLLFAAWVLVTEGRVLLPGQGDSRCGEGGRCVGVSLCPGVQGLDKHRLLQELR